MPNAGSVQPLLRIMLLQVGPSVLLQLLVEKVMLEVAVTRRQDFLICLTINLLTFVVNGAQSSVGPGAFNAIGQGGRRRTPSNPTSPSSTALGLDSFSPIGSPTFGARSRPHSRARSQPQATFMDNSFGFHFGSPGEDHGYISPDDNTINSNYTFHHDDSFSNEVNSLLMPRESSPDFDEDEQEGLVLDRTKTDSTVSMEPMDRLDVLQRANTELGRKLMEAERTLQNKLSEHELELEEMQGRLEEMKTELSATKREEKELRSKEVRFVLSFLFLSFKTRHCLAAKYYTNWSFGTRGIQGLKSA